MALSANKARDYSVRGRENALPVQASSTIYAGSALTIDTGGEVGPADASEANFAGFALEKVDNSNGSAGDVNCRVLTSGEIELTVTGLDDNNDIGDIVYLTDDNTFTLVASGAKAIGKVSEIVSLTSGKCKVAFDTFLNEHWND